MPEPKRCPQCQAEIPAGTPEGLCPQCLLKEGFATPAPETEQRTAPYSPGPTGFVPPTPAELQPVFPQFEILELLGKGGMGAVYKARQTKLDRLVAVKILPPEISRDPAFAERFTREARAMAKLHHPSIVGIHDFGQAEGYCYLVMEFVDGVNLRQAMQAGNLKAAEALKIVPQICEALQFAHDEGVVHRDIKPENVLLDRKGRVKIADFGLAKMLGVSRNVNDVSLTGTQQVMGTLHYMAPEQLTGSHDVDHRADIYSLGVTFYEMLTGELPLGRFAPPSKKVEVDVRLDEVVLRSLEREPEQRYQHASEVKTDVDQIVSGSAMAPVKTAPSPEALEQVIVNLLPDEKVAAIRYYRDAAGADLPQSMSAVKSIAQKHGKEQMVVWTREFILECVFIGILGLLCTGPFVLFWLWTHISERYAKASWSLEELTKQVAAEDAKQARVSEPDHGEATPVSSAWPTVLRVCGGLNLIAAVPLLLLGAIQLDLIQKEQMQDSPDAKWWYLFSAALCLAGVCLFIGGIGLLMLKRWGHRVVVGMSMVALIALAAEATVVLLDLIQQIKDKHIFEFVWAAIIDWFFLLAQVIVLLQDNARQLFRGPGHQQPAGHVRRVAPVARREPMSPRWRIVLGISVAGWCAACVFLFALLWMPVDAKPPEPFGVLDRNYWPYQGAREIKVSLQPSRPIYRRLILREKMEANYRGYQAGVKYSGGNEGMYAHDRGAVRVTKLTYTVELDPTNVVPDNPRLVVDALGGMSWSVARRQGKQSGPVVDAGAVLEWLERGSGVDYEEIKKKSPEDAEATRAALQQQARGVVDILHRAATNDTNGIILNPNRQFVGRLDIAVGRYLGTIQNDALLAEVDAKSKFNLAQSNFLNSSSAGDKKQSLKAFLDLMNLSIKKAAEGDADAQEKIKNLSGRVSNELPSEKDRWEAVVSSGLAQYRLQPYPFRLPWQASSPESTSNPDVPILNVGVPVMLVVWLGGTWLIFQVIRGKRVPAR